MPDPAKVKAAIIGSILVIGASIGIGIGVTQNKKNNVRAIVENMNNVTPRNSDETTYKDSAPTNVKDILDEITSARYGGYMDYGSNPLEGERSWNDDVDDDGGGWKDDGWDDDGWNDDGYNPSVGNAVTGSKAEKVGSVTGGESSYGKRSSKSSKGIVGSSKSFKESKYAVSISSSSVIHFGGGSKGDKEGSVISFGVGSKSSKGSEIPVNLTGKSSKETPGIVHYVINGEPALKPESSWGSSWAGSWGNAWPGDRQETPSPTPNPTTRYFRGKWSDDGFPVAPNPVPLTTLTPDITSSPVSSSPTSCQERKWHPDLAYTMCTNDLNVQPGLADEFYLYSSLEECCMAFFGVGACDYSDTCTTSSPSVSPTTSELTNPSLNKITTSPSKSPSHSLTSTPTSRPTVTPTSSPTKAPTRIPPSAPVVSTTTSVPTPFPTSCEERMLWHPNPFFKFCTNDSNYPSNWITPDLYVQYFYESLAECCQASFGTLECKYIDICATPTPSTSPSSAPSMCEGRTLWHPNIGFKFCTNDSNYPTSWTDPSVVGEYFHESLEKCCIAVFGTSEGCKYHDVCNTPPPTESPIEMIATPSRSQSPTPCEGRRWYALDNDSKLICSNGDDIPFGWVGAEYYYDGLEACCVSVFGLLESCEYFDICATPAPMDSLVILNPTLQPSLKQNATTPMTIITTTPPSPTPTMCNGRKWHATMNAYNLLVCSNVKDTPVGSNNMSLSKNYYINLQACCEAEFEVSECAFEDVCVTPLPSPELIYPPMAHTLAPCEAQVFFFIGNVCTNQNEGIIVDIISFSQFLTLFNFHFDSLISLLLTDVILCNVQTLLWPAAI
eukprot:CCRYP_011722-RC/>CCRYP_011722-RC protein AED:0.03 eAED:0.03 QI:148/1/1/1/1/1/3/614/837